jgi:hypothetical protein
MKTMIPLRMIGICSNCMFILYGSLDGLYPVLVLHLILLPLNERWSRLTGQNGGLAKVDSGFDYAANFSSFACVA